MVLFFTRKVNGKRIHAIMGYLVMMSGAVSLILREDTGQEHQPAYAILKTVIGSVSERYMDYLPRMSGHAV